MCFSLREKTPAQRKLVDDVPHEVKIDRLQRMVQVFRTEASKVNKAQVLYTKDSILFQLYLLMTI